MHVIPTNIANIAKNIYNQPKGSNSFALDIQTCPYATNAYPEAEASPVSSFDSQSFPI